jgi:hypothetical protein
VLWRGSTWAGTGMLTNSANMTVEGASSRVSSPFDVPQDGSVLVRGSNAGNNATLTVDNGFSNAGTFRLESTDQIWSSNLTVSSGTFSNTGILNVNPGSGGSRIVMASLSNAGTVNLNTNTAFNMPSGVYTNTGDFIIAAGKTLTISSGNPVFNQNDGTLSINGTYSQLGGAFNYNGGTITGTPILQSVALTFGSGGTGVASFILRGASTLSGDVGPDQTIWVQGSNAGNHATLTAASGFNNAGTLRLESIDQNWSSNLTVSSGTFSNTGILNVNPGSGGSRIVMASLSNAGTVNLNTDTTFSRPSGVYTNNSNSTFTIAAGKTLTISGGSPVFNQNGGTLTCDGTYSQFGGAFNYNGGMITGTPILQAVALTFGSGGTGVAFFILRGASTLSGDVGPDQTIWVQGSNAGNHATLTVDNGFSNAGTLRLESIDQNWSSNLTVSSGGTVSNTGILNVNPGSGGSRIVMASLSNAGTVNLNTDTTFSRPSGVYTNNSNSTFTIAAGKTLTISGGSPVLNQNAGTLTINGTYSQFNGAFNYNGGMITGTPILQSVALTFGSGGTGVASFILRGASTLSGDVGVGQSIWVQGSNAGNSATLTAASGFNNAGTIRLESIDQNWSSNLTASSGTFSNTGILNVNVGSGGARTIMTDLINNDIGTVNVNTNTAFNKPSGVYTNNGDFIIAAGQTLSISGGSLTNFSAGTLSGGTYNIAGTFQFPNAAITTNASNIILDGPSSQIVNQSSVNALANFGTNNGSLTLQNGRVLSTPAFTNAGTLSGTGTINANLTNAGVVSPGTATGAGLLTVTGNYTQTGTLNIKLGGLTAGTDFDQLAVSGAVMLDGTLNVTDFGGFAPAAGNTFLFLAFASSTGDFATKTGFSLGAGLFLREAMHATDSTLEAFQAQLVFQQQPSDTTAGQPITPAVQVAIVDPSTSNPIAFDNSDAVTVAIANNPGGGTLSGTLTVTVSNGIATISDLSIDKAGLGYTLNANSAGLTQVTSGAFAINPAAADHLLFVQHPTDTTAGQPISPAVTVEILDQFNNVLTNDNTDTINLSLNGAGTLNGTLTQMVTSGVATFGDLSVNQAGTGYMLNANSTGFAQITSDTFAITAAAAHHLLFSQQPTDTPAGQTISPVVVQVVDQFGNVVSNYSGMVTLSLNDNPMTGATLSGTLTVNVVNGVATFSDLSIDLAGDGYTLHATIGGGLADIDSDPFNIT